MGTPPREHELVDERPFQALQYVGRKWGRSSVGIERQTVDLEVAGSSPVAPAIHPQVFLLFQALMPRCFQYILHELTGMPVPGQVVSCLLREGPAGGGRPGGVR